MVNMVLSLKKKMADYFAFLKVCLHINRIQFSYVSEIQAIISSGDSMSSVWHQAIILTNSVLLSIRHKEHVAMTFLVEIQTNLFKKIRLGNLSFIPGPIVLVEENMMCFHTFVNSKCHSCAYYQIRIITGYACAGNAGNVFPTTAV